MNKKYILFDLDGTISDNSEGIIRCIKYALAPRGIELPPETLQKFIGPPLVEAFMEYANLTKAEAEETVAKYRERYSKIGLFENTLYSGATEMLQKIKSSGKRVILATAKPIIFSEKIIEKFGLTQYFDTLVGADLKGGIHSKTDVIKEIIRRENITDINEAIMIGDRHHDIEGARHFGMESIGVTYGFGSEEELKTAGADYILTSPEEVAELITKMN